MSDGLHGTSEIHDPLPRALDGEPHFGLLGRDPLSPGFTRLYAILRERAPDFRRRAHEVLDAVLTSADGRPPRPHKDKEHAWSARRVADDMEQWYRLNMLGRSQSGKVKTPEPMTPTQAMDAMMEWQAEIDRALDPIINRIDEIVARQHPMEVPGAEPHSQTPESQTEITDTEPAAAVTPAPTGDAP